MRVEQMWKSIKLFINAEMDCLENYFHLAKYQNIRIHMGILYTLVTKFNDLLCVKYLGSNIVNVRESSEFVFACVHMLGVSD